MIASITGILLAKSPTEVTVDVNGVGYALRISLSTFETIGPVGSSVHLFSHLQVREDALQLYGFASEAERSMFRLLLTVSGVGPRTAQTILSGGPVDRLEAGITSGDVASLTRIPGVGKKIAERIVVELRNKVAELGIRSGDSGHGGESVDRSQALLALTSLGYARASAEKAVRSAFEDLRDKSPTIEDLVKRSLMYVSKHE